MVAFVCLLLLLSIVIWSIDLTVIPRSIRTASFEWLCSIPLESSASLFLVLSLFENLFELSNQPLIELKYPSDGLLQGFAGQRINVQFALVGLC
jgi:hypothetical protein